MGSYGEENLGNSEAIKYSAKVSLWRYWLNFLVGGAVLLASLWALARSIFMPSTAHAASAAIGTTMSVVALLALLFFLWPFLARRATQLVITDKRVIAKFGLLSTRSIEMRFDKIETVRVAQSLLGRMLSYGDIIITGTGSTFDPIPNIASPLAFRAALNQSMEQRKPTAG